MLLNPGRKRASPTARAVLAEVNAVFFKWWSKELHTDHQEDLRWRLEKEAICVCFSLGCKGLLTASFDHVDNLCVVSVFFFFIMKEDESIKENKYSANTTQTFPELSSVVRACTLKLQFDHGF